MRVPFKEKIKITWEVVRRSWEILKEKPKLLLFPIISFIFCLLYIGLISGGIVVMAITHFLDFDDGNILLGMIVILFFLAIIMGIVFIPVFFNTAFFHNVLKKFHGEDISIKESIKHVWTKKLLILEWSMISIFVSAIILIIKNLFAWLENIPFLGKIVVYVTSLLGFVTEIAWGLATFFVIPIIVNENLTIKDVLKKSANLLKRTWGEQITSMVGFGIFSAIILLMAGLFIIVGMTIGPTVINPIVLISGVFLPLLIIVFMALFIIGVMQQVFVATLYVYAVEGVIPAKFDKALLDMVWRVK